MDNTEELFDAQPMAHRPDPARERDLMVTHRFSRWGAPAWVLDLLLIAIGYLAYTAVRNALPHRGGIALDNAAQIDALERNLHLDPERWVNGLVAGERWLANVCNYYYSILHFAVPIAVAIWLYRRHQSDARRLLSAWYIATALGLFVTEFRAATSFADLLPVTVVGSFPLIIK